jgi:hypothetical protein
VHLLIISDILQEEKKRKVMSSETFLRSEIEDTIINIQTDYSYMKLGYYVSMHAESQGNKVTPTCINIIDAYNNAVLISRSVKKGIPVPDYLVTNSVEEIIKELNLPLILFPLNPVSYDTFRIANSRNELVGAVRSLGMNFRYPVIAQTLVGRLETVKSIFGSTNIHEARSITKKCYKEFEIPLCKLYIQTIEDRCYLCSMSPLQKTDLEPIDLKTIIHKLQNTRELL